MAEEKKKDIGRSVRRIVVLQLPLIGVFVDLLIYSWFWFNSYYGPKIRYNLKFYFNGHLMILALYFLLLVFFMHTYGGFKVGYLKTLDVILSQIFSLAAVNVVTYMQLSLMAVHLARVSPILIMTAIQIVFSIVWILFSGWKYRRTFPPKKVLMIHGERPADGIRQKFESRPERFEIVKSIGVDEGLEKVLSEVDSGYEAVALIDLPTQLRNRLIKYCYGRSVRIYTMPKIPDVLLAGSPSLHVFDTPIFMTREYPLTFGQRLLKRLIDIVGSLILLIIASPVMLITALAVHFYDGGPVFYRQTRCTIGEREFAIIKFRSMRTDAEKDGVARLSSVHDDRITPVGRFIRKVRIDELPQLINILKGDMSFIGPRPERPEIIRQYTETMPEFVYRMKVKAGLAGYAQIYGKYNTTPYDKLKLDLSYIQNYSIWLDLKLMMLTLKILFQPESTEGVAEGNITAQEYREDEK